MNNFVAKKFGKLASSMTVYIEVVLFKCTGKFSLRLLESLTVLVMCFYYTNCNHEITLQ